MIVLRVIIILSGLFNWFILGYRNYNYSGFQREDQFTTVLCTLFFPLMPFLAAHNIGRLVKGKK